MKIEHDYLKKLLEAGQASEKPTFDIEDLKTAGFDYGDPKFEFHMMILADHGFIKQDDGSPGFGLTKSLDGFCQWSVLPLRLTSSGHQFIEALSNEEVWARIKHGYPDASIATLEVVALKLLEDYAQKKIAQEPQVYSKTGTTVFIEHEKSPETVTPLVTNSASGMDLTNPASDIPPSARRHRGAVFNTAEFNTVEFSAPPPVSNDAAALPDLPAQGPGPHFELTKTGIVDFAPPEALDREGNNVERLRRLHPTLRDLARQLVEALGTGNIPHAHLAARIAEYRKQVDQALDAIDFTLLYVEGLRLANANKATAEKVAEGELPPLREADREAVGTLLQLHGTFMLATTAGAELLEAEQRYHRRPAEEREYRAAAVDFAASLQGKPDVIEPGAAAFVRGAAEQIGHGANPERSGVVGTSTVQNVLITLAAAAAVTALPIVGGVIGGLDGSIAGGVAAFLAGDSVRKSRLFAGVIAPITGKLDQLSDVDFHKFSHFLLSVEHKALRLANYSEQFSWLDAALRWIKRPVAGQRVMASATLSMTPAITSSSSSADFVISLLNASGEIEISAQTERAQKARRLKEGETIAFKDHFEVIPYVQAAEAEGLTFARNELFEQIRVMLEELKQNVELQAIPFIQMLDDVGNTSIIIDILQTASDKEDFLRKINEASSSKLAHRIENFLRSYEDARQDVNKARAIFGMAPFRF